LSAKIAIPSFGKIEVVVPSGFTVLTSTNDQVPSMDIFWGA
jgi:hypothetical protein